jgi:N-acetyl-anhydromuramyl-L-alanine amidase AmpD
MIDRKLPKHCYSKHNLSSIDGIIVHYFSAINVEPQDPFDMEVCRNLFLDLNRAKTDREWYLLQEPDKRMYASAHVLIGRGGEEHRLVPFTKQAFHAGHSILQGRRHCNNFTLGVELVGTINSGFTDIQYEHLAEFCANMMQIHGFNLENIAGHDQVRMAAIRAGLTSAKKYDPSGRPDGTGDNFEWDFLHGLIKTITDARE